MIIIVEGIDRVGKSTFCKRLNEATGYKVFRDDFRYFKKEYKDQMVNEEKGNTFVNLVEQGVVNNAILDRFHWSEFVYGALERGHACGNVFDIERRFANCNEKVIIVLVAPTDIAESSNQHGKDLSKHAKLFESLYDQCELESYKITYKDIPNLVQLLKEKIENENIVDSSNKQ